MKKYSWIVALLLALSFTALFISCGADPIELTLDTEGLKEVELGDFNTWGGANDKQQGWATDSFVFKGVGDKLETAKAMGYGLDDFQGAKYLVLELADGQPSDGLNLIWGLDENEGGGWNSNAIMSDGRDMQPCALLEGTTLTVDIQSCLGNTYNEFAAPGKSGIRFVLQYWNQGIAALGIKSAKLLVSEERPPFVGITKIELANSSAILGADFQLQAKFTPEDARIKRVIWSFDNAATGNTLIAGASDDVYFSEVFSDSSETITDFWPWTEDKHHDSDGFSSNTIVASNLGKIAVRAIVIDGAAVVAGDVGKTIDGFQGSGTGTNAGKVTADDVGKQYNFVSTPLVIEVIEPKISVTVGGGTAQEVKVVAGKSYGPGDSGSIVGAEAGIIFKGSANYAPWIVFQANLGAGKKATDIKEIIVTMNCTDGDGKYKKIGAWAYDTAPGDNAYPGQSAVADNNYTEGEQRVTLTTTASSFVPGTSTAQSPYFGITFHSPEGATWNIKSVEITFN